jgi:lipopolysaccharide transport system ATP-binding protein
MSDTLVKVDSVSKKFCRSLKKSLWYGMQDLGREMIGQRHGGDDRLRSDEFWAIKDVSFELKRGECLGLVGRNGAGKTTLLRMLNGLIKPDQGRIEMRGRVGALISLGAGFNPILTGRENIYVNASVLGLSKRETEEKIDEIIDFSEIGEFIDAPVQNYSSGMAVRLGFSVASTLSPDILILDEVLAVGDSSFRNKCFARIGDSLSSAAVIFVSHNEAQIQRICDRAIFIENGSVKYSGETNNTLREYKKSFQTNAPSATNNKWILSDEVASISTEFESNVIGWGSELIIHVNIHSSSELDVCKSYMQFFREDDGISCASTENTWNYSERIKILRGENNFTVRIKPIYLVEGKYTVSLAIFSHTGKTTIAHSRNIGLVSVTGPLGIGPTVLLPSYWGK